MNKSQRFNFAVKKAQMLTKLTKEQLASEIGITRIQLQTILSGKSNNPGATILLNLSKIARVPLQWLIDESFVYAYEKEEISAMEETPEQPLSSSKIVEMINNLIPSLKYRDQAKILELILKLIIEED